VNAVQRTIVDRVRYGFRKKLPVDYFSSGQMTLSVHGLSFGKEMGVILENAGYGVAISLEAVLSEHLVDSYSEEIPRVCYDVPEVSHRSPRTWWDRLKQDLAPGWYLARFPVHYDKFVLQHARCPVIREAETITLQVRARYTDPDRLAWPDRDHIYVSKLKRHPTFASCKPGKRVEKPW